MMHGVRYFAERFLIEQLKDGPKSSALLKAEFEATTGFSQESLRKVARSMGLTVRRYPKFENRSTEWELNHE